MPRRRKRGRPPGPTKLTDEVQKSIVQAMAAGMYPEGAAFRAGISPRSLYGWMAKGKRLGVGKHYEFFAAVKKALAEWEFATLQRLETAEAWQSDAWLLERRFHKHWGRKTTTTIEGKGIAGTSGVDASRTLTEIVERAHAILGGASNGDEED